MAEVFFTSSKSQDETEKIFSNKQTERLDIQNEHKDKILLYSIATIFFLTPKTNKQYQIKYLPTSQFQIIHK